MPSDDGPAFEYASEEVGEAFTEWCASESIEARDNQEYRWLRRAFTAGMNEVSRYGDAPQSAPLLTSRQRPAWTTRRPRTTGSWADYG